MNKLDNWTDQVLNSLDGIQKAAPSLDLLDRVMAQLPQNNVMPKWQLRLTAAAACLLIALNIYVFDFDKQESSKQPSTEYVKLVEDFSLYQ